MGTASTPALTTADASTTPSQAPGHRWQICVPEDARHTNWVKG